MDIRSWYRRFTLLALTLVCAVALLGPASALAAGNDPTADQYGPGVLSETGAGGSEPSASTDTVGGLPFTGADLGILGGAAIVLVGGGLALRAYVRSEHAERA